MWIEAKMMMGVVAIVCLSVVMVFVAYSMLLIFICFIAVGMIIMGDMMIGYQIKRNHVDILIDPVPSNYEICILCDFAGNVDFLKVKKDSFGTRQFVKFSREATIVNEGNYQLRFPNGNHGFIGHEDYDRNVNLYKAEALDKLEGDDIKAIVDNLPTIPIVPVGDDE